MIPGSLGVMAQVSIGLLVAFLVLPFLLLRQDRRESPLLRALRAVVLALAAVFAVGFLLAVTSSVELATMGLVLGFTLVAAGWARRRQGDLERQRAARAQQTAKVLDAMDPGSEHSFATLALDALRHLWPWVVRTARRLGRAENFLSLVALGVIAWQQVPGLLGQAAPGTPDGYVQLLASKTIALNMGVYQTGTYPIGVPLVAALVATGFFFDPLNVLRFLGPLLALALPLAGALLALEIADSGWAAFTALALGGLSALPAIGQGTLEAWNPLSLHLAALMLLSGAAFTVRALRRDTARDGLWAGAAFFAATVAQPLAWPYAALLSLALGLPWLGRRPALRQAAFGLLGASLGLLPVAIGLLGGHAVSQSLLAPPPLPTAATPGWLAGGAGGALLLAAGLALTLPSIGRWRRLSDDAPLYLGLGLTVLALGALSLAPPGAPWGVTLTQGDFAGLIGLPILVGFTFSLVANRLQYPAAAQGLAMLLAVGGIASGAATAQPLARYEVQGSESTLQNITEAYQAYQWTVVSPTEQYSELLGKGWHVELTTFLAQLPQTVAADGRLAPAQWPRLPILSPDVFLFAPRVTADGLRPQPGDLGRPVPASLSAAENMGRDGAVLDAHAYAWAMAFLKAHPRSASVYFENPDLLVLHIHQ